MTMLKQYGIHIFLKVYFIITLCNESQEKDYVPGFSTIFNMRLLYLPYDTPPGTIIYRLRAYDADNDDLSFGIKEAQMRDLFDVISVKSYNADVILKRNLQKGKQYNMTLYVTDGNSKTEVPSSIIMTSEKIKQQVFLERSENFVKVPEDSVIGRKVAEMEVLVDKKWMNAPTFELRGSEKFRIRSAAGLKPDANIVKAEIFTREQLDYEEKSIYDLTIVAVNGFHRSKVDTRNVATFNLIVIIEDVPDSEPVWSVAPPLTQIPDNLKIGDKILSLKAKDGDSGNPRKLNYGIDPYDEKWSDYFRISKESGDIFLAKDISSLKENALREAPIVLSVEVTEVQELNGKYPAKSSKAQIGFLLVDGENNPPKFQSDLYVGYIPENSPSFTPVIFKDPNIIARVTDNDQGSNGTFRLYLDGTNDFYVTPNLGSHDVSFAIRVKQSVDIDYERTNQYSFKLIAKELRKDNPLSKFVDVKIFVEDMNDHKPFFVEEEYETKIPENAGPGSKVVQVQATDKDSGSFGTVKYTRIIGKIANMLKLDRDSGLVTIRNSYGLDREEVDRHVLSIEARDDEGRGQATEVKVVVHLLDSNDNAPRFPPPQFYVGILNSDLSALQQPIIVQAVDDDEEGSINSEVVYQIIGGNYHDRFDIDPTSGVISVIKPLLADESKTSASARNEPTNRQLELISLKVKAHDKGAPVLHSPEIPVYVHTQAYMNRSLNLILPDKYEFVRERKAQYQKALSSLTGANVQITDIERWYDDDRYTLVKAWATYSSSAVVDVEKTIREMNKALNRSCESSTADGKAVAKAGIFEESGEIFFGIMLFLLLLLLLLIIFLIFYCCCYRISKSRSSTANSRIHPEDEAVLISRENSSMYQNGIEGNKQAGFERLKRTDDGYWQYDKRETHRITPADESNGADGVYNEEFIDDNSQIRGGNQRLFVKNNNFRYGRSPRMNEIQQKRQEVILNVEREPMGTVVRRIEHRPRSEGTVNRRRGKVLIVNQNEWNDVRRGRLVDEMTPEEYANHVAKYGSRTNILEEVDRRPLARRSSRRIRVGNRTRESPLRRGNSDYDEYYDDDEAYEMDEYDEYYEDDDIGPSASQLTSTSQSNDHEDLTNEETSRTVKFHRRAQQIERLDSNNQAKFSRHNSTFAKSSRTNASQNDNNNSSIKKKLDDVNEEEEVVQSSSEESKRSMKHGISVKPADDLTPVKEDYQASTAVPEIQQSVETKVEKEANEKTVVAKVAEPSEVVSTYHNESNTTTVVTKTTEIQESVDNKIEESNKETSNSSQSKKEEDDQDSGISQGSVKNNKNPYLQKKSVFTIAYDGIQSKHSLLNSNADDSNRTPSPTI